MGTAKHIFQRLLFNPTNQTVIDFSNELQELAKNAFGVSAQEIIEQFTYAKKMARNVSHVEKQLGINNLGAPDELQLNTVTYQPTKFNPEEPKPTCHHCK